MFFMSEYKRKGQTGFLGLVAGGNTIPVAYLGILKEKGCTNKLHQCIISTFRKIPMVGLNLNYGLVRAENANMDTYSFMPGLQTYGDVCKSAGETSL